MITGTPTFCKNRRVTAWCWWEVDAKLQVGSFQIKLIRPRLLRVKGAGEMKTRIISRGQCTQRCETDADQIAGVLNLHDFEVKVNDQ